MHTLSHQGVIVIFVEFFVAEIHEAEAQKQYIPGRVKNVVKTGRQNEDHHLELLAAAEHEIHRHNHERQVLHTSLCNINVGVAMHMSQIHTWTSKHALQPPIEIARRSRQSRRWPVLLPHLHLHAGMCLSVIQNIAPKTKPNKQPTG